MKNKLDLRVQKTHKALCDTFLALMGEKDFDSITINELCDRAMIRRATFYTHFSDKYDFFAFFVRQIQNKFHDDYKQQVAYEKSSGSSYLIYMLRETFEFLNAHKKIVEKTLTSNALSTIVEILSDEIYNNMLTNYDTEILPESLKDSSPEILISFYTGGIVNILKYWLHHKNKFTEEELLEEVQRFLPAV